MPISYLSLFPSLFSVSCLLFLYVYLLTETPVPLRHLIMESFHAPLVRRVSCPAKTNYK